MRATRRTRLPPRADMTPLVNIALLLIVFFVWLKQVQQPVAMVVNGPINCKCDADPVPISASLYLLDANTICFLRYLPDKRSVEAIETDYSVDGLRKHLIDVAKNRQATLLIIPTPNSTVKNLVDVLDELRINRQINYVLSYQLIREEKHLLSDYQLYKRNHPHGPVSMPFSFYPRHRERI